MYMRINDQAAGHGKTAAQIAEISRKQTKLVCKPMAKKKKKEGAFTHDDYHYGLCLTCVSGAATLGEKMLKSLVFTQAEPAFEGFPKVNYHLHAFE